jgi:hypothetical protein
LANNGCSNESNLGEENTRLLACLGGKRVSIGVAKALQRPLSSSEGTMDGASNSRRSSSRSNSIIFLGGDVVVLSICCRSRSPTSSQIALQCLLPILTASIAFVPACRIVLAQLSNH